MHVGPAAAAGFFKAHRDTPTSTDMFGSLVICLPTEFTGGQLIIRSPDLSTSVTHDWDSTSSDRLGAAASSSSSSNGGCKLAWAAMYSDCEHEIKPVTTGHRVTLTYNLYTPADSGRSSSQDSGVSAASASAAAASAARESAFGTQLSSALTDTTWYPEGVTLGLVMEHFYAVEAIGECEHAEPTSWQGESDPRGPDNMPDSIEPAQLKGSDLQLYKAARALGLVVKIVPVVSLQQFDEAELSGAVTPGLLSPSKLALMDHFQGDPTAGEQFFPEDYYRREEDGKDMDTRSGWARFLLQGIARACPPTVAAEPLLLVKQPGKQHLKYCGPALEYEGNSGYTSCIYAAAAVLLVVVPPVGEAVRQG
jgi:hypothetical protein